MPDVADEVEKWRSWIEDPIRKDVLNMHLFRQVWRETNEILGANPAVGQTRSVFWDFHAHNYAAAQAVAIRRQTDRDPDSCSLAVLIRELRDSAGLLTRDYWLSLVHDPHDDLMIRRAHQGFDSIAGGADRDHLNPTIPEADFAALRHQAHAVSVYVNEHVAHDDANPTVANQVTFGDLHNAIDSVGTIFKKYALVLTGVNWMTLEPVIQDDWKRIFRVPWLLS